MSREKGKVSTVTPKSRQPQSNTKKSFVVPNLTTPKKTNPNFKALAQQRKLSEDAWARNPGNPRNLNSHLNPLNIRNQNNPVNPLGLFNPNNNPMNKRRG